MTIIMYEYVHRCMCLYAY